MHLCFGRFHFHKRWNLLIESSVMNVSSHFVLLICIHLKDRPLILILVKSALTTRLICIFVQWLLKILTTNTPNSNEINWKIRFVVPPFFLHLVQQAVTGQKSKNLICHQVLLSQKVVFFFCFRRYTHFFSVVCLFCPVIVG